MQAKYELCVVLSDVHIPFEDKKAVDLALLFLKDVQPDRIILDGDIVDCWEISKFDKAPRTGATLQDELDQGRAFLKRIREVCPKARIDFIEGNHEFRLKAYLYRKAKELEGLRGVSIPEQLDFQDLNILWHPVRRGASRFVDNYIKVGELYVGHFDAANKYAGYTAKNLLYSRGVSVLQGHIHRIGMSSWTRANGEELVAIENGCLCDRNPSYVSDPNWQSGLSIIHHKIGKRRFHAYPVRFVDYKFFWMGKEYSLPRGK